MSEEILSARAKLKKAAPTDPPVAQNETPNSLAKLPPYMLRSNSAATMATRVPETMLNSLPRQKSDLTHAKNTHIGESVV